MIIIVTLFNNNNNNVLLHQNKEVHAFSVLTKTDKNYS